MAHMAAGCSDPDPAPSALTDVVATVFGGDFHDFRFNEALSMALLERPHMGP